MTGAGTNRSGNIDWLFGLTVSLWLAAMILLGGTSQPNQLVFTVQSLISFLIVIAAAWRLRSGFPTRLSLLAAVVLLLCYVLIGVQLIPLPADIWSAFPGRDFQKRIYDIIQAPLPWQPLTLSPSATRDAALALLPATAGLLAAVSMRPQHRIWLAITVLSCALLGTGFGVLQKLQGIESKFYIYGKFGAGAITGTFGNRNFFAAQLYTTIPLVAALGMAAESKWRLPSWLIMVFGGIYIVILIIALGATASRAGIILAMIAVFLSALIVYRPQLQGNTLRSGRTVFFAALAALILVSQVGMAAILRLAETDLLDLRDSIFSVSMQALKAHFPVGAGFGTFVPVYQMFETPDVIGPNYVNHAHNDWIELVLEGGVAALVLLVAFVLLYLVSAAQLLRLEFRTPERAFLRAGAVIVLLLLLHAIVDYGLRTPALLSLFALCCGLATLGSMTTSNGDAGRTTPVNRPRGRDEFARPGVRTGQGKPWTPPGGHRRKER